MYNLEIGNLRLNQAGCALWLLICVGGCTPSTNDVTFLPPYPPDSEYQLEWSSRWTVTRFGKGGDNWPVTWTQAGSLFTAYGDGFGFSPRLKTKLSLGFGTIKGSPPAVTVENVRSINGEATGDGRSGKKASSLLAIDTRIYMWLRNVDGKGNGCQLAWSDDDGNQWQYADWQFSDLGYCVFLQFGRAYQASRDNYVYVYSPDGASAYDPVDHMVLLRVPKQQLHDRSAYEFYAGAENSAEAQWSTSTREKVPVFSNPGNCLRSGISYNAGIDRFIWWQHLPANDFDTRREGGFGVYVSPNPWGPWSTIYFTNDWDMGPGETGSFPTKWMSSDGTAVTLVFSGDDHLSIREGKLVSRQ